MPALGVLFLPISIGIWTDRCAKCLWRTSSDNWGTAMGMKANLIATAALGVSLLTVASAQAATITFYTNAAAWQAAAGASLTETFNAGTIVTPGLSVSSTVGTISGGQWSDRLVPNGASTTWSFAGGADAFGGNWDLTPGGAGTGIALTLTFFNNGQQVGSQEVPNAFAGGFFGLTSDVVFSSILLTAGTQGGAAETYRFDNLVFSPASAVPLPAALPLFASALGLGGLVGYRRKRKAAIAAA